MRSGTFTTKGTVYACVDAILFEFLFCILRLLKILAQTQSIVTELYNLLILEINQSLKMINNFRKPFRLIHDLNSYVI